jgi:DNA-binding NarL/FixJ family response regulator
VALAVLLVDDVEQLRFLVRRALQMRGGFDVVAEAADGRAAIEAAAKLQPDVVVLDLGLPDLAGRDVLTMLRVAAPDMRVVVFTGGDMSENANEKVSVATEVEGFVLKGETVQYLVDLLDDLGRRGPRSAVFRVAEQADEIASARRFTEHHGVRPSTEGRGSHLAHRGHRRRSRQPRAATPRAARRARPRSAVGVGHVRGLGRRHTR